MKFEEFLNEKGKVCNVCGSDKKLNKKGHCDSCEEELRAQEDKKAEKKNKKFNTRH